MDIEKLVEQLHIAGAGNPGNIFDVAATAISTLLAENKRLKSLLGEGGQDLWSKENQRADRLEAENEKLRAELDDLRIQWDMYGGDIGITAVYKELEQVKRERDDLIEDFVDYVTGGVPNPAIFCKNRCDKCTDMRGW